MDSVAEHEESMELESVRVHIIDGVAQVIMNRPERRNAFNTQMVVDLSEAFDKLSTHECKSIVLTGEGKAFSGGADLNYMKSIKDSGWDANREDAMQLAELLELIYTNPKPVVAKVNGPAIGGGVGLIAACDIAIANQGAFFAFSEVRLGLVPAVISPYVVKKIGETAARHYMLTGDRFNATVAAEIGLVAKTTVMGDLDNAVRSVTTSLGLAGPLALKHCKGLIRKVGEEPLESVKEWTAELIADLRASDEGQEGIGSFLEKRDPSWQKMM